MKLYVESKGQVTVSQMMQVKRAVFAGEVVKLVYSDDEILFFNREGDYFHCDVVNGDDWYGAMITIHANEWELFGWMTEKVAQW